MSCLHNVILTLTSINWILLPQSLRSILQAEKAVITHINYTVQMDI